MQGHEVLRPAGPGDIGSPRRGFPHIAVRLTAATVVILIAWQLWAVMTREMTCEEFATASTEDQLAVLTGLDPHLTAANIDEGVAICQQWPAGTTVRAATGY